MALSDKIWLSPPHMSGREMRYIQEAFDNNWVAPAGPHLTAFEAQLARYTGVAHAAALSSGTAAIHLALVLLNVQRDDLVICQSLTFAGSANPIVYQGAKPMFIDSEMATWNICPNALEEALKNCDRKGKKPKALIGVHLYGMPMLTHEILCLSQKYGVPIIEDAAEALGSIYEGKKVGSFGDMSIISFNGNKIITTSGGGALLSKHKDYIDKAHFLAMQARDQAVHYEHSEIGYNYRMSNVCAGIGRGQLEVIEDRVLQRRKNYDWYYNNLSSIPGIGFQIEPKNAHSNRWLTAITMDPDLIDTYPEQLRKHLDLHNIESRPVWKPMHLQPVYKDAPYFGGKNAELLFKRGLCLPSGSNLSEKDLSRITQAIREKLYT